MGPVEIGQTASKHTKFSAEGPYSHLDYLCIYVIYCIRTGAICIYIYIYIQKFMYLNAPGFKGQRE